MTCTIYILAPIIYLISLSTQTIYRGRMETNPFENDVKMYGTQTANQKGVKKSAFENDVKMYGTQTGRHQVFISVSLRMM